MNAAGNRVIDVISDADYSLLQSIDLTALGAGTGNLHSVAVDPLDDEIFVPLLASSVGDGTFCPSGCVAVFAQNVAEPGSLPLLVVGLAGLMGFAVRRQLQ